MLHRQPSGTQTIDTLTRHSAAHWQLFVVALSLLTVVAQHIEVFDGMNQLMGRVSAAAAAAAAAVVVVVFVATMVTALNYIHENNYDDAPSFSHLHPSPNPLQVVDVFDCGLNCCFGRRSAPPPRVTFLFVFNRDGVLLLQMARDGLHVSAEVRLLYFMLIDSCCIFSLMFSLVSSAF